jgi:hypothetical protein
MCTRAFNVEPVNLKDLVNYRREIVSEHQAELAAIDRLIGRERGKQLPEISNGSSDANSTTQSGLGAPVALSIDKALGKIGNGDFTQDHIKAMLNQMGVSMKGWGRRAIGVNLWRRAKDGQLVTVQRGTSGSPVVYRKG